MRWLSRRKGLVWKSNDGHIIQKMWTIGVAKRCFYLCYMSESEYFDGENFTSHDSLAAAKKEFTE